LLAAGITPFVTLFHWDFPEALYKRGGWLNPDSPDWFADYTKAVAARLSDRVRYWMTLNEPQVFVVIGHQWGTHAPGVRLDLKDVVRIGHNVLLAHGKAVQMLRAESRTACHIGIAPATVNKMPATDAPADVEAARQAEFAITDLHLFNNTWWLDPICFGHYPEDGLRLYGDSVPEVRAADMQTIAQPLDFVGLNIYVGDTVRAGADGQIETLPPPLGCPRTTFDALLFITPPAIYWTPRFFYERYGKPLYITENGMANTDWVALDGKVHDPQRIDFMHRHLLELRRAIADGVDVRGYFHWSFLDNFEWAEGYRQRFGLTFVDYVTQQRIPKDSFYWYQEVIRTNGRSLSGKG
ncbi:MAG: family 1 glycosylhydrolase, partial [Abditibacteriales bacterium]|nr:family 1 glycosylhydrolase [Abditibacteriales bacterium]